jgi:hypothetical protein
MSSSVCTLCTKVKVREPLAAIVEQQPDWSQLPSATPAPIRHLPAHCLERNPNDGSRYWRRTDRRRWKRRHGTGLSAASAAGGPALFEDFIGTAGPSDFP